MKTRSLRQDSAVKGKGSEHITTKLSNLPDCADIRVNYMNHNLLQVQAARL